jgi:hypothetical protein
MQKTVALSILATTVIPSVTRPRVGRLRVEAPAAVYERISGTRLVCPGGGRYVRNDAWRSMESTAFGHPGEPKEGPPDLLPFAGWASGSFGLTFEDDGLRAACELRR